MDFKNNPFKLVSLAVGVLVIIIMAWATISSSGENKHLKRAINDNLEKIKSLEVEKNIIFESIEKKSKQIKLRDSIILELKNKEKSLINNLKQLKNERIKLKAAYLSNDVNERVAIFSKLATETD